MHVLQTIKPSGSLKMHAPREMHATVSHQSYQKVGFSDRVFLDELLRSDRKRISTTYFSGYHNVALSKSSIEKAYLDNKLGCARSIDV